MKKKFIIILLLNIISYSNCFIYNNFFLKNNNKNLYQLNLYNKKNYFIFNKNELNEFYLLSRPYNIMPSIGLLLSGCIFTKKSLNFILFPHTWIILINVVTITCISMIINDYFDFKNNVDIFKTNSLITGKIKSERVILFVNIIYILNYFIINFITNNNIRTLLSINLLITYIYTPILKLIPFIKNISVAYIISQPIIIGGLITSKSSLSYTILPCIYIFFYMFWREIMLDINDYHGDKIAKIKTIPVLFGKKKSLIISIIIFIITMNIPLIFKYININDIYINNNSKFLPIIQLPILIEHIKIYNNNFKEKILLKLLEKCKIYMLLSFPFFL